MLSNNLRLKKKDFSLLRGIKSKSFVSEGFSLKTYNTGFNPSRFAVVVPVSVYKKAVQRNKTKRRFKGIVFKHAEKFKNGFAVVIYPKNEKLQATFNETEQELMFIFKKANILR